MHLNNSTAGKHNCEISRQNSKALSRLLYINCNCVFMFFYYFYFCVFFSPLKQPSSHILKARNSILFTPLAYLPVYLIAADFENIKNRYHTWSNLHLLSLSRCVSAELSPSLCDCTTWWEFWSASQKGSDSLILLSSLHIYKSKIYLCFLFPEFCSVNFHMLQYFFWACVCVSVCVRIGKAMMSGIML